MKSIQIETTRFGRVDVPLAAFVTIPRGLYGLEKTHSYCLLPHDEAGHFQWLQAMEEPALAMLMTDPFPLFPNYEVQISDPAAELLQVTTPADVTVFVTVTLDRSSRQLYANLLGPLILNHRASLGAQVIQDSGRYTTRHLILERPLEEPQAAGYPESVPLPC